MSDIVSNEEFNEAVEVIARHAIQESESIDREIDTPELFLEWYLNSCLTEIVSYQIKKIQKDSE